MKWIKTFIFLVLVLAIANLCNFMFWDDVHSFSRVMIKEMYKYDGNIDTVFLGSSYVVHGMVPEIADEELKCNTYNAGTKLQSLDVSYYMLREIDKKNDIKTVYLDVSNVMLTLLKAPDWGRTYLVSVYMKPSLNQVQCAYDANGLEGVCLDYFPFLIRRKNNFIKLVREKLDGAYEDKNYKYVTIPGDESYMGNGYVKKEGLLKADDNYEPITEIDPQNPITLYSYKYLDKIVEYCKENNIELIFYTVPVASEMLKRTPNCEKFITDFKDYAKKNDVEYHNYNLVNTKYCNLQLSDFAEKEHLNDNGARKFTRWMCKTEMDIKNGKVTKEEVFFDTLQDKLSKNPDESVKLYEKITDERNIKK